MSESRYEVVWSSLINHTGEFNPYSIFRDFMDYLYDLPVRLAILKRFAEVVQPLLAAGHEVDVISHSEGTMVSYEGLRMIAPGLSRVRNFFTVGTALGYAWNPMIPRSNVRDHLLEGNMSGDKPAVVDNWWNVFAIGEPFGSPLIPAYKVDQDFRVPAVGCGPLSPGCVHSSYFNPANVEVNKNIFAAKINESV